MTIVIPNFRDPRALAERPAQPPEKIEFLASDDFPPFSFRDPQGRLTGFNVDLARAVCEELGASCSLRVKAFEALPDALMAGEGDAILSGLARTEALRREMAFSDTYMRLPARFVLGQGTDSFDPGMPSAKRISVEAGSRHEAFLKAAFPGLAVETFPTAGEARAALKEGKADVHFGDGMALSFWLASKEADGCCRFVPGPWLEPRYFGDGLSIALRRDDQALLDALNYALRQVQDKGIYGELYLRYFPVGFY
ncbi:transporter substrate-binding domain-containing protein [Pannonibacter phragmitetus]|uniref:transporter substrate-binding domain-containing protein n=1 Tax=Pannonibacter phragmitetus TaxID=121719 RepID=UPI000F451EC1|nr:transporter substrate-binding domain-containing protein [Pannonibacter phragmitetus]MBA4205411.1 amino acid ABC transporter substrate-binding protein [Polymorphum sp.]